MQQYLVSNLFCCFTFGNAFLSREAKCFHACYDAVYGVVEFQTIKYQSVRSGVLEVIRVV